VYTVESTLAALEKYDIDQSTLAEWENKLNLSIAMDENGQKRYSPHHVNLFKNIRKHLALGRTLEQIRDMITLPPDEQARPAASGYASQPAAPKLATTPIAPATSPTAQPTQTASAETQSASASSEPTPMGAASSAAVQDASTATPPQPSAGQEARLQPNALLTLVERLMMEKDQLNKKLVETEKLNSHLYNANALFHRKVKEHMGEAEQLRNQLQTAHSQTREEDKDAIRHLDEKSKLHKQLLDMEKHLLTANQQIVVKEQTVQQLGKRIEQLEGRVQTAHQPVPVDTFTGTWQETAQLSEVVYDSFGINFEADRSRVLNIPDAPRRVYGNTAILFTQYDYDANPMWKRHETLVAAYQSDNQLTGELFTEFLLDGVPVGKAVYTVTCTRQQA
jgi:DNA-binding transcriptional MerR regulator